jgi:hypothetical protein
MQRNLTVALPTLGVLAVHSAPIHAQQPRAAALLAPASPLRLPPVPREPARTVRHAVHGALAPASSRPRATRYVLWGAAVGAGLSAAHWARTAAGDDCDCRFVDGWPVIAGYTALGAGGGYVVYRVRFR